MNPIQYITESERDLRWGLSVCSVGYQSVEPGAPYPPHHHAENYLFNPVAGRVLQEYQLLYVVKGRGVLRTEHAGEVPIEAGTMFLIFPGEWHTYQPNPETGWDEYWIGFKGPNIDQRVAAGFFSAEHPVYHVGNLETAVGLYRDALHVAMRQEAYFQQLLCGIVNHLLGLMFMTSINMDYGDEGDVPELINHARTYMQQHIEEDITMPNVASALNVSYTTFRRLFKHYTGLAPSQYFINLRLHRAKQLLRSTDESIKEISFRLHFENPEYFATLFKKRTGMRPSEFRNS